MKKLLFIACIGLLLTSLEARGQKFRDLYVGQLQNDYLDHLPVFDQLFDLFPIENFLELGLGEGTRYFLENFPHVRSVELVTSLNKRFSEQWYGYTCARFGNYACWTSSMIELPPLLDEAETIACQKKISPPFDLASYEKAMSLFVDTLLEDQKYDVIFVDPGLHLRGDIVQCLFGKADIIVAHDTSSHVYNRNVYYGWDRIRCPLDYEKIAITKGCGTTCWIKKEKEKEIRALKTWDANL